MSPTHVMKYAMLAISLLATAGHAPGQDEPAPPPPPTLAEAAAAADLVALVQVADTDYETARDFPTGGTAYLRVLIPYKVTRPLEDLIEVYEEGLHEGECYFPTPKVTEEGGRFLVFLRFNPNVEGQYLGLPHGCSLEALVTRDNRYVLRYPLADMPVAEQPRAFASPREFQDSYAAFADDDMSVEERNALLDGGYLVRTDEGFRFTHGVGLSDIRRLIGSENLTDDRFLRRVPEPVILGD